MNKKISSLMTVSLLLAFSLILSVSGYGQEYEFVLKWGGFGTGDGQFQFPFGIAVDSNGYVYVTDSRNHRIQKFDSNGIFFTEWGSFGTGDSQFRSPSGIAVDSDGFVYVIDYGNNRVQKFDSVDGINYSYVTQWGSFGSGDGQFDGPLFISVESDGYIYVADEVNYWIQKFDSNGTFITNWGSFGSGDGEFGAATGVTVDSDGYVYVSDTINRRIQKFDSTGTYITQWGSSGSGDGEFGSLAGIAADSDGNIYVSSTTNNRVQKFDSNGSFITKWGSPGTGDGEFDFIWDVAVDHGGSVYVVDGRNHRIQKFASLNTLPGNDVVVELEDPETGESPVTMTFDEVTEGGETTLVISDTGPPPTNGFKLGDPETFYEIETTASYSGFINICIDYSGVNVGDEDNLRFSHYEGGMWVEMLIISHDMDNDIICGQVASLSTFALFEPITLDDLTQLVQASGIHSGLRKSLVKKLQNAQKSLEKGQFNAAINKIEAFQNEVRAQSGKKIPTELANEWMEISEIILDSL